jgi:hypothetical protein
MYARHRVKGNRKKSKKPVEDGVEMPG